MRVSGFSAESPLVPFESTGIIEHHGDTPWQQSILRSALLESIGKSNQKQDSIVDVIREIIVDLMTKMDEHGIDNTHRQLRLLGNYLRILSHKSIHVKEFIKQLTWGIEAGALDNSCSGEKEASQAIIAFLRSRNQQKRLIAFDIGANSGDWTLQMANTATNIDIHSFEPNTNLRAALISALEQCPSDSNGISTVVNMFGLYSATGKQVLYVNGESSEQATLSSSASKGCFENSIYSQEVKTLRGDEDCAAKAIYSIDYLKIDTEGTELEVLKSFGGLVGNGMIGFVQFEYGNASFYTGASMMKFFEILGDNYILARILPEGLEIASKYDSSLETFQWCNYLAVHRQYKCFLGC